MTLPPRKRHTIPRSTAAPIVYSCSGCSSSAQMANWLAIRLDRMGVAEMSCITGVGGDVPALVRLAKAGRTIIALDGCPLHCSQSCLKRHSLSADVHFVLSDHEVKKTFNQDFDPREAGQILSVLLEQLDVPGGDPSTFVTNAKR